MQTFKYLESNNERIDKVLSSYLNISRTHAAKLIEQNVVYLNHQLITKPKHLVVLNDQIKVLETENKEINTNILAYEYDLKIIYEDNDLLVVYKPSGMLVHPSVYNEQDTLVNALKFYFKDQYFYIAHRLDKFTSGMLIVAKNPEALEKIQSQFMNCSVDKAYYALVENRFDDAHLHFMIDEPIGHSYQDKLRMRTGNSKNPKEAKTIVKVLEQYINTALVSVQIITGRTHQIRVHMRHINHPVINDPLYGSRKHVTDYEQFLHAYYLKFIHPTTNQILEFKDELPNEFLEMINKLKHERY